MKNKVFIVIFLSHIFAFLIGMLTTIYVFGVNVRANLLGIGGLSVLYLAISLVGSNILSHYLIENQLKPVTSFMKYITDILMNNKYDEEHSAGLEDEVIGYLRVYGYGADQIEEGLEKIKYSQLIRREFSSNVSHELKSPLTSINGYAEMIASGMADLDQSKEFAKIINQQGNVLLKMIDETILLSEFDENKLTSETFTQVNLTELILENINFLEKIAKEKDMLLEFRNMKEVTYLGNEKLLNDLIRNLITNAIKYGPNKDGHLIISLEEDLEKVTMVFQDNGIGIDPINHERVFERFYVVDKSRGNKTGTGLGLALVKNIARLHRGSVQLESTLGQGSTFTVYLPINHTKVR